MFSLPISRLYGISLDISICNLRPFLLILLVSFLCIAHAQEYNLKPYRVQNGLPSDIVKATTQDSLGYFWIATDEGIVRYDGIKFKSYRNATHSNYTKGFYTTRSGKLLAFGDLDLIEIRNSGDTVIFKEICSVDRVANDTTLSYPKQLFEDFAGNLWVSESQSVVKLNGKSFKRYEFDLQNRTSQFLRSFTFFEDPAHNLFVTSFQGNVFRYNKDGDQFEDTKTPFPPSVESVVVDGSRILIGAADGLWQCSFEGLGLSRPVKILELPSVSSIQKIDDTKYILSTRGVQHYLVDLNKIAQKKSIGRINNINHVYLSKDKDIWLSSNDGLILMRENLFVNANLQVEDFIETIDEDPRTGMIYYATATKMYSFNPVTKENKLLLDIPDGYFQSILTHPKGIWIANAFKVMLYHEGKIRASFDFSSKRKFITALAHGFGENIWLTIPGSKEAYRITGELKLETFQVPFEKDGVINAIRNGRTGVYIASTGKSSYLFFKAWKDSVFHNISKPLSFPLHRDFNVTDLVVEEDGIWMATTEGLVKVREDSVEHVNLGEKLSDVPIVSLASYPAHKLLISNAHGMVLLDKTKNTFDLYTESSGLLSNTITGRGLFVGKDTTIWLGTAKGLCYSTRLLSPIGKTPLPKIITVTVNGENENVQLKNTLRYRSFLSFTLSSITFPESEILFKYRFSEHDNWSPASGNEINLAALPAGKYTMQIRANKNGPYLISDMTTIDFEVDKPYWKKLWFIALIALSGLVLISITVLSVNSYNRRRQKVLEQLVALRTDELRKTSDQLRSNNEALISLNQEKNNLIGIVAHDLKNPLSQIAGLIMILKMTSKLDAESNQYIDMMDTSTKRLTEMISKILNVQAIESKELNLKMETLNLSQVLKNTADRFEVQAGKKQIAIHKDIAEGCLVNADQTHVEQVLENLISNAIKFSPPNREIFVSISSNPDKVICKVEDEGPGMSEEDKKKLFGRFQRLSAQPTGDETSTGLGLSIVKKYVDVMNGQIWCESELGNGTSFFVSFNKV